MWLPQRIEMVIECRDTARRLRAGRKISRPMLPPLLHIPHPSWPPQQRWNAESRSKVMKKLIKLFDEISHFAKALTED